MGNRKDPCGVGNVTHLDFINFNILDVTLSHSFAKCYYRAKLDRVLCLPIACEFTIISEKFNLKKFLQTSIIFCWSWMRNNILKSLVIFRMQINICSLKEKVTHFFCYYWIVSDSDLKYCQSLYVLVYFQRWQFNLALSTDQKFLFTCFVSI